jgi:GTP cyclohydrolase II
MHSSCLTGDLLGSLRCDCGDQLRRAVQQLSGEGGGVLLYLSQEGRGIGLASKLRAYRLQDAGLDTLDANNHLGFEADERSFDMAAQMLRAIGVPRIRLLTSNPWKVKALRAAGIDVVAQEPLHGRVNRHNARYIQVKQERAGHLPRDLSEALGPERD